jgi:hypothetical protein
MGPFDSPAEAAGSLTMTAQNDVAGRSEQQEAET